MDQLHSEASTGLNGPDGLLRPVRLASAPEELAGWMPLLRAVQRSVGDVPALLRLAADAGRSWPRPGEGKTALLWELLASVTAVDVAAGRVFEPHVDALAILHQAGARVGLDRTWGVFAAEGPGMALRAEGSGTGVLLTGSKPWCSLAGLLQHAVVTAHTDDGGRAAFAVDLKHSGVTCDEAAWIARGLQEIPSGTVNFDRVPAAAVGPGGWYLSRPGFALGGMGVAACWLGGAVGVARDYRRALLAGAEAGREPDQLALAALGEVDRILASALQYLARTADAIDQGSLGTEEGRSAWSEALRVRGTVAAAVERVLDLAVSNRGPAPLAFDEQYAKRTADLALYVRQHHGSRDDAHLGALTLEGDVGW